MKIKTIAPVLVLSKSVETTLAGMDQAIGNLPQHMTDMITEAGRQITGPQIWIYHSADGTPDKPITIQVTIPVDKPFECPAGFECTALPSFRCIVDFNNGPWKEVGKVYENMMQHIETNHLKCTWTSREIYHVCDFENQDNCVTEVQLGIE